MAMVTHTEVTMEAIMEVSTEATMEVTMEAIMEAIMGVITEATGDTADTGDTDIITSDRGKVKH